MQITVRYVAALRDRMGRPGETLDLPEGAADSEAVIARLRETDAAAEAPDPAAAPRFTPIPVPSSLSSSTSSIS